MKSIGSILVANRGEIALRVMRSAREMDITTIAVYSDTDRHAPHVRMANYAYSLDGVSVTDTYLNIEKIILIAQKSGADAIHPGYGFLSENARFAQAVLDAGLIFIGPTPEVIRKMGDKITAKQIARSCGVPLVPGTENISLESKVLDQIATDIGFPVLIKASAGGGGKGMRVAHDKQELESLIPVAQNEAQQAFGDSSVFIEKYIEQPKHIEMQVLADHHGYVVHLHERECSIQRRHQKLIEEAPSPSISDKTRAEMGKAAIEIARACGYRNAGTVEFMLDQQENFYFLEMNTRLQVEHPVTEMITGVDLVKAQIRIARDEPLGIIQENIPIQGHSIELRINAEDPHQEFMPSAGKIGYYNVPDGTGLRMDSGYEQGMEVASDYDAMIAKLIVHGKDRQEAIDRMKRALQECVITGIATTIPFGQFVMEHAAFIDGSFNTKFVEQYWAQQSNNDYPDDVEEVAALFTAKWYNDRVNTHDHIDFTPRYSSWLNRKNGD